MNLFNESMTKQEILEYFGDYNIACGYRQYVLEDGKSEHMHICELNNGAGIRFEILKTRGMDIGRFYYKELPLSFCSYNGDVHANYYEALHDSWLRNFGGGLLVTCGLTNMGAPVIEHGESLPLHGRISNIPTEQFCVENIWINDDLYIIAKGRVREAKALHYNLVLNRTISMKAGENIVHIHDEVSNEGFEDHEHMMLYHFNIGYPLLDKESKFYSKSDQIIPRDSIAESRSEPANEYLKPTSHYPDVVYYHKLQADKEGKKHVALVNKARSIGIALTFNDVLDEFTQWKFTNKGNYVAGIEPCNARVNGRTVERKEKRVKTLKAQETVVYDIDIQILTSDKDIDTFLNEKDLIK